MRAWPFVLLALLAAGRPAFAGLCISQGEALSCTDGGETVILRGGEGSAYAGLAGRPAILTRDASGNLLGLIGEQKLAIVQEGGVLAGSFGKRRFACLRAGPGILICK